MAQAIFVNLLNTTLAQSVSITSTTLVLSSADNLPTLEAGQFFPLWLSPADSGNTNELVYVTGISGSTLTVERAQEGTAAQSWQVGDYAYSDISAGTMFNPANPVVFSNTITQTPGQGANNSTPFAQYGDLFSDAIMSGLTTTTSSTLSGTLAAGDAYVIGQRVVYPGGNYTVAASSTSYLDLSDTGQLTVSTSATVTANSLRLWAVTSSATAITGVTQVAPSGVVAAAPVSGPAGTSGNQFVNYQQMMNGSLAPAFSTIFFPDGGGNTKIYENYGAGDFVICTGLGDNYNFYVFHSHGDLSINGSINSFFVSQSNSATLNGTTAGTIVSSMPEQGVMKKFGAYANAYENDTTTAQTITFPTAFANPPVITTNTTGLSLSVSTTGLTINAPNNTTTYTGLIIVEGF